MLGAVAVEHVQSAALVLAVCMQDALSVHACVANVRVPCMRARFAGVSCMRGRCMQAGSYCVSGECIVHVRVQCVRVDSV
eukprot:4731304-Pleurochrysis_carterae.AAC.1